MLTDDTFEDTLTKDWKGSNLAVMATHVTHLPRQTMNGHQNMKDKKWRLKMGWEEDKKSYEYLQFKTVNGKEAVVCRNQTTVPKEIFCLLFIANL